MSHRYQSSHLQPTLSGKAILPDVLNVTTKELFLFLNDHFLMQDFCLPMHKIYKEEQQPKLGNDINGSTFLQLQIRQQGKTMTEIVNPFPSQPNTNVVADALDSDRRLAQSYLHLFHSHSHTYSEWSHQMLSPLPTLPWAHARLGEGDLAHLVEQIRHSITYHLFFYLLKERCLDIPSTQ